MERSHVRHEISDLFVFFFLGGGGVSTLSRGKEIELEMAIMYQQE